MSNSAPTAPAGSAGVRTVVPSRGQRRTRAGVAAPPAAAAPEAETVPPEEAEAAPTPRRGRISAIERDHILARVEAGARIEDIAADMNRSVDAVAKVANEAAVGEEPEEAPEPAQEAQEATPAPRSKSRQQKPAKASSGRRKKVTQATAKTLVELTRFSIQSEISFDAMRAALALLEEDTED